MAQTLQPIGRFRVAADHACLPGHFPGGPVVPGVVLLDEAMALVEAHAGRAVAGVPSAKFVVVVTPGQEVEVQCGRLSGGPLSGGRLDFACVVAGVVVARGAMRLAEAS